MTYVIPGTPTAWKRAGLNKGKHYDTQAKLKEQHGHLIMAQRPHPIAPPSKRALQLLATYYFKMPKSWSKSKQALMVGQPHISTKDLDNLNKYIGDVCQGLLFFNDCQIASDHTKKVWAWEAKTEFQFVEIL